MDTTSGRVRSLVLVFLIPCALWALVTAPARFRTALMTTSSSHVSDDFGLFYTTTECLMTGACDPYASRNFNPPHTHVVFAPLLLVERTPAFFIFLGLNTLIVLWIVYRLARSVLDWRVGTWAIVAVGVGLSSLTEIMLITGQIYILLGAGVIEAWLSWRDGRWNRAAIIMGVLISVKPILALPALWMLRERPATWKALALAYVAPLVAGVLVFGLNPYFGYARTIVGVAVQGSGLDGSLWSAGQRMLAAHGTDSTARVQPIAPIFPAPWLVLPAWIGLSILLLIDMSDWTRRARTDAAWVGLLSAMLLISPKGWVYMGWLVVWPALVLWQRSRSSMLLLSAAFFLIPMSVPRHASGSLSSALVGSLYTWAWFTLYFAARSQRERHVDREVVDRERIDASASVQTAGSPAVGVLIDG